jgi:hypothetical protein
MAVVAAAAGSIKGMLNLLLHQYEAHVLPILV